ncbi:MULTISPECIES: 1,4-dihydroxy-2-naphthoate octaprenyltransferase [Clostridium]|jgi:1,4-dihydroxy-2-naphthoate octaprenyltransferase|uniref:1,4-dihydroxy-2-naphthoate octaprenyltransferase n=2 Tax=Clostridium beijerinckii TaxID=1520 RepID=A0AAW3W7C2_CLOBE|nr:MULTISPECIES: 1,4-dihydroxy-2-naphthoate octaprenyltransferase [Clostridium]AVK47039.1 1,4-dihydroxy-2-naphthoate octaprenyltransferase [Clostridium sp. MF28]MBC2457403.1 1,4-dihydroxy-2-naphthoate octaprenyltransferase [Clostridium beijerinckii]MBC2474453.1 1,4-dihydroxy-2-naphthoate octaprenyltransferase [Clostridium beijerinckii]MDG5853746.1 1,4-dihydroxy-2-naphthoate octaprenyltransferase [Clostridium beijerinckii]NOV60571.1 1,4-dihydroxy-2-naphthoate octaprenyltransferase [Clostridium 
MTIEKIKLFIRASRPFSLTASAIPVVLGEILALKEPNFNLEYFILSIIAIVFLQASVNLLNDHDDFINKVDTKESHSSSGVVVEGLLTLKEVYRSGILLLILGCLIGLFLAYNVGIMILILGIVGALCGYFYTGKPLMLKYRGLGAPLVFIIFGPLMTLGGYYLQMQKFTIQSLVISIPTALLTTAILHANDIRDIKHDKKAGIKTLSISVGYKNAQIVYSSLIILSYISLIIMIIFKYIPYLSLICLLTVSAAVKNINKLRTAGDSSSNIAELDKESGKLQGQFGILLILSILLAYIL